MAGQVSARDEVGAIPRSKGAISKFWDSLTLRILLVISTAGLALWVLWGPRLRHAYLYPSFGDLSGWLAGIGALAAVVVALFQTHQLRVDREDDLRRQEEQQRTQVFGWIAYREESTGSGDWWVYLNNMTPVPIGVWVLRIEDAETGRRFTLDVTQSLPILPGFTQRPAGASPGDLLRPFCVLEFADAAGICWRRDASGRLHQIPEIRVGDQILAASSSLVGVRSDR